MLDMDKNKFLVKVVSSSRIAIPIDVRNNLKLSSGDIVHVEIRHVKKDDKPVKKDTRWYLQHINKDKRSKHIYIEKKPKFKDTVGIEPELLWSLLWGNGYGIHKIAKMFNCGDATIREGMRLYDIQEPYRLDDEQKRETVRECIRKRRLKMSQLSEDFTREDWLKKVEATAGVCPTCSRPYGMGSGLTLDHIVPVAKAPPGFCYTINDVQPMCRSCNASKHDGVVF